MRLHFNIFIGRLNQNSPSIIFNIQKEQKKLKIRNNEQLTEYVFLLINIIILHILYE